MSALSITKNNFQEEVINSKKPVLLDFWASWCGPCRMVSPIVDEIAEERSDVKVCKVNVEEQRELAAFLRALAGRGVKVAASNSDPHNADPEDDFFDELYRGFAIRRVPASRMINSVAAARGKVNELLITSR